MARLMLWINFAGWRADCEIALHGIDAWLDDGKGSEELKAIQSITGTGDIGVRMRWAALRRAVARCARKRGR